MIKYILNSWRGTGSISLGWTENHNKNDYYFIPYANCLKSEIRYMMYQYSTGTFLDTNSVRDYKALMNELAQGIFYIK